MPEQDSRGAHTRREILGQTLAWKATLQRVLKREPDLRALFRNHSFDEIIFTGCGSTYYLSLSGSAVFQISIGVRARALPASELLLFPRACLADPGRTLLVAVSRSGQTTETRRAIQTFRQAGGQDVVVITCYQDSPMVAEASLSLVAELAEEQSVAQTRSFSSMLVLAHTWAWLLSNQGHHREIESLPSVGERLISENHDLARQLGEDSSLERFFFLGSGPQYGLACEAMLKMKEMSLSYSEAFHFMEFRHGPMSMVNDSTLVVGLLSSRTRNYEVAVLKEMRALGARTLVLAEEMGKEPLPADYLVCFESGLPEAVRGVLYMPILQLIAYHRAMHKGLNPDSPKHLSAVVILDE